MLAVPVDKIVNAAYRAQDTVKLLAGQAEAQQVYRLVLDPALFKPPFRLF